MSIAEGVTRMEGLENSDNITELGRCDIIEICESGDEFRIVAENLTVTCLQNPQRLPLPFMTFIQICYAIICVVGLCGNSLVIFVVLRYSKMQTVTNIYILMLAVADECFLLGLPFLIVTAVRHDWVFGMAMCKIYQTTTAINQFTSSIFLTVMSADRYIAVCHPISSPKFRTPVIARVVSLTAWTCSALLMVPVFMYAATITKQCGGQSCNIFWPFEDMDDANETSIEEGQSKIPTTTLPTVNETYGANENVNETEQYPTILNGQTAFTFYSFFLGFAIPLGLILVFYILVIFKLKTVGPKNKSKEKKKSHRKVTRLVLTVITVYICCWLPYWITQLALIFTPPGKTQENVMIAIFLLAGCLSYSNSAMNPVLYAFLSENFKKSFLKACQCAAGREVNDALQVEHSVFPRRRTLAGMRASVKDAKNAAVSRMQKLRDKRRKDYENGGEAIHHNHQHGSNRGHHHTRIEDDELERQELNDMSSTSQGNISRTTRSCYNSSACPTAMTAASASASVVDDRSTCGINSSVTFNDVKVTIQSNNSSIEPTNGNAVTTTAMVNGNLAPPPNMI